MALRESAKQHRASGDDGHAAFCETHRELLREAAGEADDLLTAAEMALALIRNTWPEIRSRPNVGRTWGALEAAISRAKGGLP